MLIFIINTETYTRYVPSCQNRYQTNKHCIENEKSSFKIQNLASTTFLIFYLFDKLEYIFYWCFLRISLANNWELYEYIYCSNFISNNNRNCNESLWLWIWHSITSIDLKEKFGFSLTCSKTILRKNREIIFVHSPITLLLTNFTIGIFLMGTNCMINILFWARR